MTGREIVVRTRGFCDIVDITGEAAALVSGSDPASGLLSLFIPGSTASLTTLEYEPGAVDDLRRAIERLAPQEMDYAHDARWGDGNGFSHVRAALIGPSLVVPFRGNRLLLGTWQQIVLIDFDNGPRERRVLLNILG